MSLVILRLKIAQLVVPFQMLVVFRQGLVRFLEESFVLGANGSLNVCVHWYLLLLAGEQIYGQVRNTLDSKGVGKKKADGSGTRNVLTSFHVGRRIYTDRACRTEIAGGAGRNSLLLLRPANGSVRGD